MVGKHPIIPPVKRTYHKIYPDFLLDERVGYVSGL
jgi:hypothetical protein